MHRWTTYMLTMLVAVSSTAVAGQPSDAGTLRSTYLGERGGFTVRSIDVPRAHATIELLEGESGVALLVVSSKATGKTQSFVLPEAPQSRSGTITTQVAGDIELEPLIERSDGSGVYAARRNGEFIGFMTVSASGVWNFIRVDTQPK